MSAMDTWVNELIEDLRDIKVEKGWRARQEYIERHHMIGERIWQDENYQRGAYGKKILQRVARSLDMSLRTIQYDVEFAEKYPDLEDVPWGKDVTWSSIVKEYLTESEPKGGLRGVRKVRFELLSEIEKKLTSVDSLQEAKEYIKNRKQAIVDGLEGTA